jgi:hypothetical protein
MDQAGRRGVVRRIGIMLTLGAAALAGIKWIQSRELLLTNLARPITSVDSNTQKSSWIAEPDQVAWLSSHELLCITTTQASVDLSPRTHSSAPIHKNRLVSVDILNTTTHGKAHLTGLTDLFNRTQAFPTSGSGGVLLSPDHAWIVWDIYDLNRLPHYDPNLTCVSHLDGTHHRTWDRAPLQKERLFLDSRHLALVAESDSMRMRSDDPPIVSIRDLQEPNRDRTNLTWKQIDAALAPMAVQQPVFMRVNEDIRLTAGNVTSLEIDTYRMQDRIRAYQHGGFPPLQKHQIQLPADASLQETYVSPRQRLIAYRLQISRMSPILTLLHRILPTYNVTPARTDELWVSRADGTGMHEIGHEPFTAASEVSPQERLEEIQWLPDGKQIGFAYEGTFYVASAETER